LYDNFQINDHMYHFFENDIVNEMSLFCLCKKKIMWIYLCK